MNLENANGEDYPVYHSINTKSLFPISEMVANFAQMSVQPNKAVVGENAFRHESGIHQAGE
jgi:2-isopropylmalate synthase